VAAASRTGPSTPVSASIAKLEGDMNIVLNVLPTVVLVAAIALVVMLVRYFLRIGRRRSS
jgi:uncharacterized protein HemY